MKQMVIILKDFMIIIEINMSIWMKFYVIITRLHKKSKMLLTMGC
jgi:hypothetical protein